MGKPGAQNGNAAKGRPVISKKTEMNALRHVHLCLSLAEKRHFSNAGNGNLTPKWSFTK